MFITLYLRRLGAVALLLSFPRVAEAVCVGDCDASGQVVINELITGVNIASGVAPLSHCPSFDANGSGAVTVDELIRAVNAALAGCPPADTVTPEPAATATAPATDTAIDTPTETPAPSSTATATASSTPTASAADTASPTATGSATPSASETATAADTAAATPSPDPSSTPTPPPSPSPTDTAPPTPTFTPSASPTAGSPAVCGNGFIEPGETCAGCPTDCTVGTCTASATTVTFPIQFAGPPGTSPTTATTLLGYRSDRVALPGSGSATSVRQRVTFPTPVPNIVSINDLDYAVRVVVGRTAGLTNSLLYSVRFDTCQGAPAVVAADFACTMEACAGSGGPIDGCTCRVAAP